MALVGKREKRILWIAAFPMGLLALSCLYPIWFAINNALKDNRGYVLDRFGMVTDPTLENFVTAWGRARFSEYFLNSVVVTGGAVALLLVTASLASFALAVLRFHYRRLVFVVILAALMIPVQVVLVPFYQTIIGLGLLNTRIGLILSYTAFFLPFSVYLMTAFYAALPRELTEAARIDGARFWQVWWFVMLPLGRPALITLGILNTLYCWNDVLISLLVLQDERTLMVGITALRGGVIEQVGRPTDLYDDPDNAFVAGFIGSPKMNFIPMQATAPRTLGLGGLTLDLPHLSSALQPGAAVTVGVRPEHLADANGPAVDMRIDVVEQLGSTAFVHGQAFPGVAIVAEKRDSRPATGDQITLHFDPARVYVFNAEGQRQR